MQLLAIQATSPERRFTQKEIIAGEERPKYLLIKQLQDSVSAGSNAASTGIYLRRGCVYIWPTNGSGRNSMAIDNDFEINYYSGKISNTQFCNWKLAFCGPKYWQQ